MNAPIESRVEAPYVLRISQDGRLVPLDSTLSSGDTVEVFTSKNPDAGPSHDWLNFVTSTRAKSKIRQWFTKERRDEAIVHERLVGFARGFLEHPLPHRFIGHRKP